MPSDQSRAKGRRLLLLSQYFVPEMGAPQVRLSELGQGLAQLGWQVEVLTALPNYPTGRILPGYSRWRTVREEVGDLAVGRVPLWPAKSGIAQRLISYLSFALTASLLGPRVVSRPDLILVESPPLFIGWAARWLAWRWRCPFVLNVSDLWPQSFVSVGMLRSNHPAVRVAERLELKLYRQAAAITGQSNEIIEHVQRKVPGKATAVITNGCDPSRFGAEQATAEARHLIGDEPGPVFIYAGLLGIAQGLDRVLDLATALPREVPGRFVLVGDGPVREHLEERLREERIDRVRLLQAQPREKIPPLLAAADAALISLGSQIPGAVPSKIYEAMASSLPILLIAEGEPARRVEAAGCGIAVSPDDPAAIRNAFTALVADANTFAELGRAGRLAAESTYDRARIVEQLHRFLARLPSRCAPS